MPTCKVWSYVANTRLFAEGCRGHLGKQLIEKFSLDTGSEAQHYGLGIKELWVNTYKTT